MRNIVFCLLCVVLAGCITVTSEPDINVREWTHPSKGLTNIRQVQLGMTDREVASLMGDQVVIGYQASDSLSGAYEAIPIKSPYRDEVLSGKYTTYKIIYYYTHVQSPDGIIADDELTPLVFKEGKLIGKGRDFLFALKDKLE